MTVSSSVSRVDYVGTGIIGPYTFPFRIFAAGDLTLTTRDLANNETTLVYGTDYSVTGVGNRDGGSVTLTAALATGYALAIRRVLPLLQTTDIRNQGEYFPEDIEDALDYGVMIEQQQQDGIDRTIRLPVSVSPDDVSVVLPPPVANFILSWNDNANGLESRPLDDSDNVALPGGGRTVSTLTAYLANNAQFNVVDFGADRTGATDSTTAFNLARTAAIAAGGGVVTGPAGTYILDGYVIKDRVGLAFPGSRSTTLKAKAGGAGLGVILLDTGPVQGIKIGGFSLAPNGNAGQHGMYLKAVPILVDAIMQGGLWYSQFEDIDELTGFSGEGIWLYGGGDPGPDINAAPHQFLDFSRVRVLTASTTKRALRITGMVGQVDFDAGCRFNGASAATAGVNILIERHVDAGGANDSDRFAYSINFNGSTTESRARLVTVERGQNIVFNGVHLEEAREGILADVSSTVRVNQPYAGNVGSNGGAGWIFKVDTASDLTVKNPTYLGSFDKVYVRASGVLRAMEGIGGNNSAASVLPTSTTLVPNFAAAATLNIDGFREVVVDSGTTTITTLTGWHAPGEAVTVRASVLTKLATGGNLLLGTYGALLNLPVGAAATFLRTDFGANAWVLVAVSSPGGNLWPGGVSTSTTPYAVLPGVSVVEVDATAGVKTVTLPAIATVPTGHRVTVFQSAGANAVLVNGNATGENPMGAADGGISMKAGQCLTFQRTATNWFIVSEDVYQARPYQATTLAVVATAASQVASNPATYGYQSAGQADDIVTKLNALVAQVNLHRLALIAKGIVT